MLTQKEEVEFFTKILNTIQKLGGEAIPVQIDTQASCSRHENARIIIQGLESPTQKDQESEEIVLCVHVCTRVCPFIAIISSFVLNCINFISHLKTMTIDCELNLSCVVSNVIFGNIRTCLNKKLLQLVSDAEP
jgi:hypothetical protein